jgi:hypothetical protein
MTTKEELQEKVRAAEAARKVRLEEAQAKVELRELEEKLALAELEQTHGIAGRDFGFVFSKKTGDMIAVRTPPEAQWQKLQQSMLDEEISTQDLVDLVYATLLYPSKPDFEKICSNSPGIIGQVTKELTRLAEAGEAKTSKK